VGGANAGGTTIHAKGFTLIELVILVLVIGIISCIALPNYTASLSNLRASKQKAYVASLQADLLRLLVAEENYFRDSLKYTSSVVCATPPTPGVLNFCPSRGNLLAGPTLAFSGAGPGWEATMSNGNLPDVVCAVFLNAGAPYPALVEGKPLCRGAGWSGHATDTTGQIK
jgi:prepilin-type N-terminal cleavage/methylation domain-containing protein